MAVVNSRCPTTSSVAKKIMYADQCMEKGIALARTQGDSKERKQCWFPIQCPLGHTRVTIPLPPNSGYFGSKCPRPKWTTTCFFYDGRYKESSQATSVHFNNRHHAPAP
ncbi:hypothetical protein RB195_018784 [Necator americanus]